MEKFKHHSFMCFSVVVESYSRRKVEEEEVIAFPELILIV